MKNLLIASTAIVATAGVAAADVALSGRAEMGIFQQNDAFINARAATPIANPSDGAQFFTDIDVTFTMSGETDNGLTFGASVDLDEGGAGAPAVANNADDGGATIFISGGFGTVTMGDTDGALDWALTEAGNVGNPGSIADDETAHAGYLGSYLDGTSAGANGDGQILRWDFTAGAFGVAISLEDDNGSAAANTGVGYAIGFKYALDLGGTTVNLGLGYQEAADNGGATNTGTPNDITAVGVSADATFANGLSAGIVYTDFDDSLVDNHIGIGLGYTTGAFSIHANYGKMDGVVAANDQEGYGLSAAYDLGGGAVVHFGYGAGDRGVNGPTERSVSLGLGLSF